MDTFTFSRSFTRGMVELKFHVMLLYLLPITSFISDFDPENSPTTIVMRTLQWQPITWDVMGTVLFRRSQYWNVQFLNWSCCMAVTKNKKGDEFITLFLCLQPSEESRLSSVLIKHAWRCDVLFPKINNLLLHLSYVLKSCTDLRK